MSEYDHHTIDALAANGITGELLERVKRLAQQKRSLKDSLDFVSQRVDEEDTKVVEYCKLLQRGFSDYEAREQVWPSS